MTGCGRDAGNDAAPTGTVAPENTDEATRVRGNAVVENYLGVVYTPYDVTVTEEEIQTRLDSFTAGLAEIEPVTDHTDVRDGDIVNIDYTGYMDGEPFENGSDTGFDLEIGSGSFIDGFESGLIGAEVGSTVDVDVTFPDPYQNNPDFSGKPAVFTVTVNSIGVRVVPELTDELVAANTDYETVELYRQYIESSLKTQRESYAASSKQSAVMTAIIENTEFTGIEEEDIQSYYDSAYNYYSQLAQTYESIYGYSFNTFIYYFFGCTSEEQYETLLRDNAEFEVHKALILYNVIEQEKLELTQEEYDAAVTEYAASYNITEEEFLAQVSEAQIRNVVLMEKAENLIYDSAVAEEAEG